MLLTTSNIDRFLRRDKMINVPHREIFTTIAFHAFVVFAGMLLFNEFLIIPALIILGAEAYQIYNVVYRAWRKVGYSKKIFIAGGIIYLAASAIAAAFVRAGLAELWSGGVK